MCLRLLTPAPFLRTHAHSRSRSLFFGPVLRWQHPRTICQPADPLTSVRRSFVLLAFEPCATSASPDACAERHDLSVAVTRCATHGGSVSAARVAVRARDVLCANAELSSTRGCASRALVRHATVRLSSSPTAPSPVLFAPSDESPRRSESSCHNQHHPCGPVHSTTPRSCL